MRPQNSTLQGVAEALVALSSSHSGSNTSSTSSSASRTASRSSPSFTPSSKSPSAGVLGALILQGLGPVSSPSVNWEACQASQVAWSEGSSSFKGVYLTTATITETYISQVLTFQEPLGTASPYTTIDGIPHVHGDFEATATSQYIGTYAEASTFVDTEFMNSKNSFTSYASPSPTCTIPRSICKSLWQSYLASLGAPTDVDSSTAEPIISPVPTNRPRCSYMDVISSCESAPSPSCYISASKVDVFYWPQITQAPSVNGPVIAVHNNMTFTSPSVYLQFDFLQARSSLDLDQTCNFTIPLGGGPATLLGGGEDNPITDSPALTSAMVSLDPSDLSSFVRDLGPGVDTSSVINEIAHAGPSYSYWINAVLGTRVDFAFEQGAGIQYRTAVKTEQVDFANFDTPSPEAYYLNPNGAFGCSRLGPHRECETIFDAAYRAQLSVPHEVIALQPAWSTCSDYILGVYDPPIALTPVANIEQPSVPGGGAGATTPPSQAGPTSGPAVPGVSAPPTVGPTTSPSQPTNNPSPPRPQPDQSPSQQSHPIPDPSASQPNPLAAQPNTPVPQSVAPAPAPASNQPSPGPPVSQQGDPGSPKSETLADPPQPPATQSAGQISPIENVPSSSTQGGSSTPGQISPVENVQPSSTQGGSPTPGHAASQSQPRPQVSAAGATAADPGQTSSVAPTGNTADPTATQNGGQVPVFFPQPTASTSIQGSTGVTSSSHKIRAVPHILTVCIITFALLAIH